MSITERGADTDRTQFVSEYVGKWDATGALMVTPFHCNGNSYLHHTILAGELCW
jgi:hypothetical protein